MYFAKIPNCNCRRTYLLRESYRENGPVKNGTLADVSHLTIEPIQLLSRVLKGEKLIPADERSHVVDEAADWLDC